MNQLLQTAWTRLTKCESGKPLNPLMHVFMYLTLTWGIAMTFFGGTETVSATILYQETRGFGSAFVSVWGIIALAVMATHTFAALIRNRLSLKLMGWCVFGGFYLWLWAGIIYIQSGFLFQFFIACVPNLCFWGWYAWQRMKRKRGDTVAFV